MPDSEILRHPIIEVSIGGTLAAERPSSFLLNTLAGCPAVIAELRFPAGSEIGKEGGEVAVSLTHDDKTDLYFTGTIYRIGKQGQYRILYLTDSYRKLWLTEFTAAYRKEKAASVLEDILGAAGIAGKSITCPGVELARFSTARISAGLCVDLLIDALKEHGAEGLTYFFDEKDVFHFGTAQDTGKNDGGTETFETGKNIIRSGTGRIEILPRPIRHTQAVTVDGAGVLTVRTELFVSRKSSRQTLWFREGVQ
jgi:hypothetical protein